MLVMILRTDGRKNKLKKAKTQECVLFLWSCHTTRNWANITESGGATTRKSEEERMRSMQRKFLEDMGLAKEVIDKILDENSTDIGKAKGDYDDLKKQLAASESQIKERDKQLEELKKTAGDSAEMQKQIADLQAENNAAKEKYEAEMKDLKLSTAIKLAVGENAQDADLVAGLFDRSKLILSDDGKITGLEEQIKAIRESKPFLFKESNPKPSGFRPLGAGPQDPKQNNDDGRVSMKSAIEAKIAPQLSQQTK